MSAIKFKDASGKWNEISTIAGPRGKEGPEGKEGPPGKNADPYNDTELRSAIEKSAAKLARITTEHITDWERGYAEKTGIVYGGGNYANSKALNGMLSDGDNVTLRIPPDPYKPSAKRMLWVSVYTEFVDDKHNTLETTLPQFPKVNGTLENGDYVMEVTFTYRADRFYVVTIGNDTDSKDMVGSGYPLLMEVITDSARARKKEVDSLSEEITKQGRSISALETGKQDKLTSGTTIKTINGQSVLGSGNITIQGGSDGSEHINPVDIVGSKIGRNLFNPYAVINGEYVDYTNGSFQKSTTYCRTDFIEVKPNTMYSESAGYHYAWYDNDKAFIRGSNTRLYRNISPENARYIVVDLYTSNLSTFYLYEGDAGDFEPFEVSLEWLKTQLQKITAEDLYGGVIVNLFDKELAIDGTYVDHNNGSYINKNSNYWRSGYIEVKPSTQYKINNPNRVAFYDENKTYITGYNGSATFTSPSNAKYIMVCNTPLSSKNTFMLCEASMFPDTYEPYGVTAYWLKSPAPKSKYDGKKLVCFGDSITNMGYTGAIKSDTGIDAINVGMSSARYAYSDDSNQYVNAFALHNIVDALVSGDWTIPDSINGVAGYEGQYAHIQELKGIDFSTVDFASFAYGTNDFSSATPLDNESNLYDINYFKGAMRYSLKKFMTAYPHIKVIVSTPVYRFFTSGGAVIDDCDTHKIGGFLLSDYTQAEKEVCDELHIPYVDNLTNSGINAFNRLNYFSLSDPLHPNEKGRAVIGHKIGNGILSNY